MTDCALLLSATAIVCLLGITNDSLWIDEGSTAWFASHPTLQELLSAQKTETESEAQMPFYIWYIWIWARLFGTGEVALRASNAPFLFLLLLVFQYGSRAFLRHGREWLIVSVSPFVWFYMNEARPYVAIMALSAFAVISLIAYFDEKTSRRAHLPWLCLLGTFICAGMSMLGVFLIPSLLAGLSWALKKGCIRWQVLKDDWLMPVLAFWPAFLLLGIWYTWTLLHGVGGFVVPPTLANLCFAGYEFLGFLGLGPPRTILRADPSWKTLAANMAPVVFGAIAWLLAFVVFVVGLVRRTLGRYAWPLMGMLIVGGGVFLVFAYSFQFRFWGRHLAQLYPIFLLLIMTLPGSDSQQRRRFSMSTLALVLVAGTWMLSSGRLRFIDESRKDDYRSAVALAKKATEACGTILWAADDDTGSYYGLRFLDYEKQYYWRASVPAYLVSDRVDGEIRKTIAESSKPIVVVLGKQDLFDEDGAIARAIAENKAELIASPSAFNVYVIR